MCVIWNVFFSLDRNLGVILQSEIKATKCDGITSNVVEIEITGAKQWHKLNNVLESVLESIEHTKNRSIKCLCTAHLAIERLFTSYRAYFNA